MHGGPGGCRLPPDIACCGMRMTPHHAMTGRKVQDCRDTAITSAAHAKTI